jgi:hypothetical protein
MPFSIRPHRRFSVRFAVMIPKSLLRNQSERGYKRGRESFFFAQSVDVNLSCNRVAYLTRADKHLSRASCPAVELL